MKKIIAFMLAVVTVVLFTACVTAQPKEYTHDGMTITLTDAFNETTYEGFTVCYETFDTAVFAFKEDFETYPDLKECGLNEYSELFIEANSKDGEELEVVKEDTIPTIEYSFYDTEEQCEYKYLAAIYKTNDAFWVVQFACKSDKYDDKKSDFVEWAKSVEFDAEQNLMQ